MTLTNHMLTGVVIAKVLPAPIAIPLAFVSHFVLDALPHFGFINLEVTKRHKKLWVSVTILDIIMTCLLVTWLIRTGHYLWLLTGLVAYSPDILWIYRFIFEERFGKNEPTKGNWFIQFHSGIQRYERPWGAFVELAYAVGCYMLIR